MIPTRKTERCNNIMAQKELVIPPIDEDATDGEESLCAVGLCDCVGSCRRPYKNEEIQPEADFGGYYPAGI